MKRLLTFAGCGLLALTPSLKAAVPGSDILAGLILDQLDTNSDGSIDTGEWQSGTEKGFDEMDLNLDGFLNEAEMDALSGPISEEAGAVGGKLAALLIKSILMTLDKNGDKLVSKAEYKEGCEAIFKKLDVNHDGKISKQELEDLPIRLLSK